jgi:hypothetical protein
MATTAVATDTLYMVRILKTPLWALTLPDARQAAVSSGSDFRVVKKREKVGSAS